MFLERRWYPALALNLVIYPLYSIPKRWPRRTELARTQSGHAALARLFDGTVRRCLDASVISPLKNGARQIGQTLEQVRSQRTTRACEIIVIDSGSTDGSLEIARRYDVRLRGSRPGGVPATADPEPGGANGRRPVSSLNQDAAPADEQWLEELLAPLERDPLSPAPIAASCRASIAGRSSAWK